MKEKLNITFTILKGDLARFQKITANALQPSFGDEHLGGDLVDLSYIGADSQTLGFESALKIGNIAYSKEWSNSLGGRSGSEVFRFITAGQTFLECTHDHSGFISISELERAREGGDNAIRQLIEIKKDELGVISWEQQKVYSQSIATDR